MNYEMEPMQNIKHIGWYSKASINYRYNDLDYKGNIKNTPNQNNKKYRREDIAKLASQYLRDIQQSRNQYKKLHGQRGMTYMQYTKGSINDGSIHNDTYYQYYNFNDKQIHTSQYTHLKLNHPTNENIFRLTSLHLTEEFNIYILDIYLSILNLKHIYKFQQDRLTQENISRINTLVFNVLHVNRIEDLPYYINFIDIQSIRSVIYDILMESHTLKRNNNFDILTKSVKMNDRYNNLYTLNNNFTATPITDTYAIDNNNNNIINEKESKINAQINIFKKKKKEPLEKNKKNINLYKERFPLILIGEYRQIDNSVFLFIPLLYNEKKQFIFITGIQVFFGFTKCEEQNIKDFFERTILSSTSNKEKEYISSYEELQYTYQEVCREYIHTKVQLPILDKDSKYLPIINTNTIILDTGDIIFNILVIKKKIIHDNIISLDQIFYSNIKDNNKKLQYSNTIPLKNTLYYNDSTIDTTTIYSNDIIDNTTTTFLTGDTNIIEDEGYYKYILGEQTNTEQESYELQYSMIESTGDDDSLTCGDISDIDINMKKKNTTYYKYKEHSDGDITLDTDKAQTIDLYGDGGEYTIQNSSTINEDNNTKQPQYPSSYIIRNNDKYDKNINNELDKIVNLDNTIPWIDFLAIKNLLFLRTTKQEEKLALAYALAHGTKLNLYEYRLEKVIQENTTQAYNQAM